MYEDKALALGLDFEGGEAVVLRGTSGVEGSASLRGSLGCWILEEVPQMDWSGDAGDLAPYPLVPRRA